MNGRKKVVLGSICGLLVIWLGLSFLFGRLVYNGSVGRKVRIEPDKVMQVFAASPDKPLDVLKEYKNEKVMVEGTNGYDVETLLIKSNINTKNTVIMIHGIGRCYYDYLRDAVNYLERGYNVVLYNQRHTESTGGNDFTFGYYERYDTEAVAKYVRNKIGDGILGVHGFSMGAATAAMHSEINEKNKYVDFYILDSPYDEMKDAIRMGIEAENIPLVPISYINKMGDLYTRWKAGFSYDEVVPYKAVQHISKPMMLIHGTEDEICDPNNSKVIYDNISHNKKELWYIEGNPHVNKNKPYGKEYYDKIFEFINKNVSK